VIAAVGPWVNECAAQWRISAPNVRTKQVYGYRWAIDRSVPTIHATFARLSDGVFAFPRARNANEFAMSVKHDVYDVQPVPGVKNEVPDVRAQAFAEQYFAGQPRLSRRLIFSDTYTPDDEPLVHDSTDLPGLTWVTGLHGSGVRLAPGVAIEACQNLRG